MELSANIELLFTEAGSEPADRVRAAAAAGIHIVEIWRHSDKDLSKLGSALQESGSTVRTMLVEGYVDLANRETHAPFLEQVRASSAAATQLECPYVVAGSGGGFPFMTRAVQHDIVVDVLARGAQIALDHGVVLLLENLNTRVDHPGILFDTTPECVAAVREVDSSGLALLYDLYHSLQMGESPTSVMSDAMDVIAHVQIADLPDRTEPGTGTVDCAEQLRGVLDLGYAGPIGLEYHPTTDTLASLAYIQRLADAARPQRT
jgi:hydroxypyruvate isomerase